MGVYFPRIGGTCQKQATCHASGRARLSISGAAIAGGLASTWEDPHVHDSLEGSAELSVGVVAYRPANLSTSDRVSATTLAAFCILQALRIEAASLPTMSLKRAARRNYSRKQH